MRPSLSAGDLGFVPGSCPSRKESQPLNSRNTALFLQNYFPTMPVQNQACKEHSVGLAEMVNTCYKAAGNMMPNYLAVNFYMRSTGGGIFDVQDKINGLALCGCNTISSCEAGSPFGVCKKVATQYQTPVIDGGGGGGGSYSGSVQLSGSEASHHFYYPFLSKVLSALLIVVLSIAQIPALQSFVCRSI